MGEAAAKVIAETARSVLAGALGPMLGCERIAAAAAYLEEPSLEHLFIELTAIAAMKDDHLVMFVPRMAPEARERAAPAYTMLVDDSVPVVLEACMKLPAVLPRVGYPGS